MEFNVIRRLFEDKQIVNPMNPEEMFSCKDLVDGTKPSLTLSRLQSLPQRTTLSNAKELQDQTVLRVPQAW